ncbi:MAG: helix-turn-helix domain-containing protein [Streptosporangiales bacterium]|nr:helix-turn-helix domain-containing protein [Streptosporangiales bacterium]
MSTTTTARPGVGPLLRDWRRRRRLSQLDLSIESGISTRHLSFVETGRSVPSRDMVLRLAEHLGVPLRERNRLLLAAGYAPVYRESGLDEPEMASVREALRAVLAAHEPYPAVVLTQQWELVEGNAAVSLLIEGVTEELLRPPVNALRLTLHPDGMAPRIRNLGQWSTHLLDRLTRQVAIGGDPVLGSLLEELRSYGAARDEGAAGDAAPGPAVPLLLDDGAGGTFAFYSVFATFGTAVDITLDELAIETFLPADTATMERLHRR